MRARKMGRWEALCKGTHPFLVEGAMAEERGAKTRGVVAGQLTLTLDEPLPGFETPLWGFDGTWLYLRQPEGMWKVEAPKLQGAQTLMIHQVGRNGADGHLGLDSEWLALPSGWRHHGDGPLAARELDEAEAPPADCPSEATEAWRLLTLADFKEDRVVFNAGEAFGSSALRFGRLGDWLLAREPGRQRVVAFDLRGRERALDALAAGQLWLRFEGDWMGRTVEVQATLEATR